MTTLTAATLDCQAFTYEYQAEEPTPLDVLDLTAPFDFDQPMPDEVDWDARYAALVDYPACASTFGHPADPEW